MKIPIILPLIILCILDSGNSGLSNGKYVTCRLFAQIYPLFGGEDPKLVYNLFTRNNPRESCDLQPTEEAIQKCKFNPHAKTKVIIHGWEQYLNSSSAEFEFKDKLLKAGDYNVVVFDWTAYSNTFDLPYENMFNYKVAIFNSLSVGLKLSSWTYFLQEFSGIDLKNVHIITFSLGSEVASSVGKTHCGLGHITFLDAAAPVIRNLPKVLQPSSTDADFVEAIHTDGAIEGDSGYGFLNPIADIDYYPNGGQMQPKCHIGAKFKYASGENVTVESSLTQRSCNHVAAFVYYTASINKTCKFLGLICDNYEDYTSGKCSSGNAPVCRMGFYSEKSPDLPVHTKCYLKTLETPPYCLN